MTKKERNTELLQSRGLSKNEAEQFIKLLDIVKPTSQDKSDFNNAMESEIPFEGGMGFTEALTGLKFSLE